MRGAIAATAAVGLLLAGCGSDEDARKAVVAAAQRTTRGGPLWPPPAGPAPPPRAGCSPAGRTTARCSCAGPQPDGSHDDRHLHRERRHAERVDARAGLA